MNRRKKSEPPDGPDSVQQQQRHEDEKRHPSSAADQWVARKLRRRIIGEEQLQLCPQLLTGMSELIGKQLFLSQGQTVRREVIAKRSNRLVQMVDELGVTTRRQVDLECMEQFYHLFNVIRKHPLCATVSDDVESSPRMTKGTGMDAVEMGSTEQEFQLCLTISQTAGALMRRHVMSTEIPGHRKDKIVSATNILLQVDSKLQELIGQQTDSQDHSIGTDRIHMTQDQRNESLPIEAHAIVGTVEDRPSVTIQQTETAGKVAAKGKHAAFSQSLEMDFASSITKEDVYGFVDKSTHASVPETSVDNESVSEGVDKPAVASAMPQMHGVKISDARETQTVPTVGHADCSSEGTRGGNTDQTTAARNTATADQRVARKLGRRIIGERQLQLSPRLLKGMSNLVGEKQPSLSQGQTVRREETVRQSNRLDEMVNELGVTTRQQVDLECVEQFHRCFNDEELVAIRDHQVPVRRLRLMLALWCLVLRILDVMAEFFLTRMWRSDLVQRWNKAFTIFQLVAEGQQQLASSRVGGGVIDEHVGSPDVRKKQREETDEAALVAKHEGASEASGWDSPDSLSKKTSPGPSCWSGDAIESELVGTPTDSHSLSESEDNTCLDSASQQMDGSRISDDREHGMVSSLTGPHGHSHPPCGRSRPGDRDQTAAVCDETVSPPVSPDQMRLLSSLIAAKWKQVAYRLKPQTMDYRVVQEIARRQGNLKEQSMEMLEMWRNKHGLGASVELMCEVLINAHCRAEAEEVFGLNTVEKVHSRMSDSNSEDFDELLYDLAVEVGVDWKELAIRMGGTRRDIEIVKMEAHTSREQAWNMLCLLHSRLGHTFKIDDVRGKVQEIRKQRYSQQLQNQIFPENLHDDKTLCGRQKELDRIVNAFWGKNATSLGIQTEIPEFCLQVVTGMGGIGKSAFTAKYASLWKKLYGDGVFYFNAESVATLSTSIRKNLRQVSFRSSGGGLFDDNEIFLQYVYSKAKVLLLYDGADDLSVLEKLLPRHTARVHVLVTTRMSGDHPILARAHSITSLGRLTPEAGVEALQAWRGHAGEALDRDERMFAMRLVSEGPIDGLPLAIAHAGTLMRLIRVSCQDYYQLLKSHEEELRAMALHLDKLLNYFKISHLLEPLMFLGVSQPSDLSRLTVADVESIASAEKDRRLLHLARHFVMTSNHVHLTWQFDIEKVSETDSNAMELLLFASLMACKNIPELVLRLLVFSDAPAHLYSLCVTTLTSHTLVDVNESNEGYSFDIHPLVHSTLLERIMCEPQELRDKLIRMCQCFFNFLPPDTDADIKHHLADDKFISLVPHVYAVAEKALWISDDETCVSLVEIACRIALQSQHVVVAYNLCHERLKATEESTNTRRRWTALYGMGDAFQLMVKPHKAQAQYMKALQLLESTDEISMTHEYGLVLGRLAICYQEQQMFTQAESFYQRQLSLLYEQPNVNARFIATVLNNLAGNYERSGRIEQAIDIYGQALEVESSDARTDPLSVSTTMGNLGRSLCKNNEHRKALSLLEKSLVIKKHHLPEDHNDVANALGLLSLCCQQLGEAERAMQLCEEAVAIASHCLPDNHPHIAVSLSQLATCHYRNGDFEAAISLGEQCAAILRTNLPSTRSELCTALCNLGAFYCQKGRVHEGIGTLEECLVARRSFLPQNHPDIGTTLGSLGKAYEKANNVAKATELFQECLSVRENCLPATHPDVIAVLLALARIAYNQEKYYESLQMYGRLHDSLTGTSQTEDLATVCQNMGMCYMNLSNFDAAEKAFTHCLNIKTAIYPQGDARMASTERALHKLWQLKFGH